MATSAADMTDEDVVNGDASPDVSPNGGQNGGPDPAEPQPATAPRTRRRRGRPSRARGQPNSSDDATARWTIRGVPSPVRDMALKAASERGMTVGDWVAEAIIGLARGRPVRAAQAEPGLPATQPPPDITKTLRALDDRLTRMEARQQAGFFGRLFGRRV